MRLYFAVARSSFRRTLTYRMATFGGLVANGVFGVLYASVYQALYRDKGAGESVEGLTLDQLLVFVWVAQSLIATIAIWGWWEIAQTIQTGDIVSDLMKPFHYFGYWLARDLGRAAAQTLMRSIPTFTIGLVLYPLDLPSDPMTWLAFATAVILAVLVSFAIRFLLNLGTFWVVDIRGVSILSMAITNLLSGMLLPLAFFPGWLQTLANALPFRAMIMSPIDILIGNGDVGQILIQQAAWAVGLGLCGIGLLQVAVRRVVVQGG